MHRIEGKIAYFMQHQPSASVSCGRGAVFLNLSSRIDPTCRGVPGVTDIDAGAGQCESFKETKYSRWIGLAPQIYELLHQEPRPAAPLRESCLCTLSRSEFRTLKDEMDYDPGGVDQLSKSNVRVLRFTCRTHGRCSQSLQDK
jgi:hypothetical protein